MTVYKKKVVYFIKFFGKDIWAICAKVDIVDFDEIVGTSDKQFSNSNDASIELKTALRKQAFLDLELRLKKMRETMNNLFGENHELN